MSSQSAKATLFLILTARANTRLQSTDGANFVKRGMLDSMAVYFNVRPPTPAPPPAQTVGGGGRRREAATSAGTYGLVGCCSGWVGG